ncbi:MAG: response regulator transcription factor [Cyanobacteria bacterium J06639_1]
MQGYTIGQSRWNAVQTVNDGRIRVIIADDQSIIREGLQVLLASDEGIDVVGSAENGRAAIEAIAATQPDVVLLDIEMPAMDGLEATQIVRQRYPNVKVLILSSHDDGSYLLEALQAGASGYLLKSTAASEIGKTIRSVHTGNLVFGPGMGGSLVDRLSDRDDSASGIHGELIDSLNGTFDPDRLQASAHYFSRHPEANRLWKLLSDDIYGDSNSLPGLYLAGWFARLYDDNAALAMHYFASGIERGISIQGDRECLNAFYRAGKSLQPDTAFGWLVRPDSPWQGETEGRAFLLAEAAALFGSTSATYEWLRARSQLRAFQSVSQELSSVAAQLDGLQRGFRELARPDRVGLTSEDRFLARV